MSELQVLIAKLLERNASKLPNTPALMSEESFITHYQLYINVLKLVTKLEEFGIAPGKRVALRIYNPITYVIFYLTLLRMGVTQMAINPKDPKSAQKKSVTLCDIEIVIQDILSNDILSQDSIFIDSQLNLSTNFVIDDKVAPLANSCDNLPVAIFLGSGTTGEAKVIAIESALLLHLIQRNIKVWNFNPGERFYSYSEVYYQYPKIDVLNAGLTLMLPGIKPKNIVSYCLKYAIDHLYITTTQLGKLLSTINISEENKFLHLPKLKSLVVSGSPVPEQMREKVFQYVTHNMYVLYGTNEFGFISIANSKDQIKHKGTVGKACPGLELMIVDNDGKPCKVNEVGNILIKSSAISNVYLNDHEEGKNIFTKEGYFPGDMGKLMEDGNLIFEGRKDDMMIIEGVNIYPRKIELILESHINVKEAAVFPLYNKNYGDMPYAVVTVDKKISEKYLHDLCKQKLGWCRPHRIFFVKELPRNNAGKVMKKHLAEQLIKLFSENN